MIAIQFNLNIMSEMLILRIVTNTISIHQISIFYKNHINVALIKPNCINRIIWNRDQKKKDRNNKLNIYILVTPVGETDRVLCKLSRIRSAESYCTANQLFVKCWRYFSSVSFSGGESSESFRILNGIVLKSGFITIWDPTSVVMFLVYFNSFLLLIKVSFPSKLICSNRFS